MILTEFAPAKINLFLSIINKMEDGYHNIGTMFHTVNCGDLLFGEQDSNGEISISYNNPQEYSPEKDLVCRAAEKLKEKYNVSSGVRFYLEKNLPLGAGLGGGSSDAAAALRLLNKLWGLNASSEELEEIGASLGADIAFFVKGGAALATGIGNILSQQSPIESDCCIILATPKCVVPTSDAYKDVIPVGSLPWQNFLKNMTPLDNLHNQFEETILKKYPLINFLKQKLNACGGKSLLSGSGASVFSIFNSLESAVNAYERVKGECRFLRVASFF
jgi:4-diphosphocytidyl-2-C-methyl-D-erythritol kinase